MAGQIDPHVRLALAEAEQKHAQQFLQMAQALGALEKRINLLQNVCDALGNMAEAQNKQIRALMGELTNKGVIDPYWAIADVDPASPPG